MCTSYSRIFVKRKYDFTRVEMKSTEALYT